MTGRDHQDMENDAYNAVAEAVQSAREAVGEAPTTQGHVVEDFGKLSAEPLLKFCEAAAVQIEQVGHEIRDEGNRLSADCERLATDIRHVAEEQAKAIRRNTSRTRKAAVAMTEIRDEFRADLEAERAEIDELRKEAEQAIARASA
jgi:hypothetical protein